LIVESTTSCWSIIQYCIMKKREREKRTETNATWRMIKDIYRLMRQLNDLVRTLWLVLYSLCLSAWLRVWFIAYSLRVCREIWLEPWESCWSLSRSWWRNKRRQFSSSPLGLIQDVGAKNGFDDARPISPVDESPNKKKPSFCEGHLQKILTRWLQIQLLPLLTTRWPYFGPFHYYTRR